MEIGAPPYGLELDDFGLIYIVMASAVAHGRLLGGHVLPEHHFSEETAVAKQIRQVVAMFWNRMGQEWHIVPEAAEYCWLEDILRQLVILNLSGANKVSLAAMTDRSCKSFAGRSLTALKRGLALIFLWITGLRRI